MNEKTEYYPSEDPLNEIVIWPRSIRRVVVDALWPYIRINKGNGNIQWVSRGHVNDDIDEKVSELVESIRALYGYSEGRILSNDRMLELANELAAITEEE